MKMFSAILLCLLTQPVLAAMSLDKIIVYLSDQPNAREDILVSNPDSLPLYLQTEIYRVDNAGLAEEQRVRVVDPKEFKLLVSPAKAVVPAGEEKLFRLMSLDRNLETEKVYRVTFKPVVGELESNKSALKILVAYQVLIFVQPQDGRYQLVLASNESGLSLVNRGNINVEVVDAEHCLGEVCKPISARGRVYPGAALVLDAGLENKGILKLRLRGKEMATQELSLSSVTTDA